MPGKVKGKRRQTKDRVVQARIPEQLDDELRDRAEQLGLSVSTVVRNVLFNTFNLVEGVVSDSADIARAITGKEAHPPTAGALEGPVLGWQEAVLNQNGVCDQCNAILPKGERGAIGVPFGSRPMFLCLGCLEDLSGSDSAAGGVEQD
ncbi:MAG: hypothetical protein ACPG1A_04040 [Halioglobus sp.]